MTEELFKLLKDGYKVTNSEWQKSAYIYWNKRTGAILTDQGVDVSRIIWGDTYSNNWSIFQGEYEVKVWEYIDNDAIIFESEKASEAYELLQKQHPKLTIKVQND